MEFPREARIPVLLSPACSENWTATSEVVSAGRILHVASRTQPEKSRWALLADLHIGVHRDALYKGFSPEDNLTRALEQVREAGPDAALINGDIAWNAGLMGDYRRCRSRLKQLAKQAPVALTPGNHDSRDRLLQFFAPDARNNPKVITTVDAGPVRLVVLDSLYRTDVVPGLLGKLQRDWLRDWLDAHRDKPVILTSHHPVTDLDGSLLDGDRLLQIAAQRRQVKAILTAHEHRFALRKEASLHIVEQPAVGFSFDPEGSTAWLEAEFSGFGATLRLRGVAGAAVDETPRRIRWRR